MKNDDDLEFEGQESCETNYIIDPINETQKSIVFGLYSQLNSLKNFYNRIQNHYKRSAITWLIAAHVALGFLFSQKEKNLPFSPFYIALFVLFAAMCGITLLWFLEISIYETYFFGVVIEELKLEKKNPWLPKINRHIAKNQVNPQTTIFHSHFYLGCQYILLLYMSILALPLVNFKLLYSIIIFISAILLGLLIHYMMIRIERPKELNPIREQLKKYIY